MGGGRRVARVLAVVGCSALGALLTADAAVADGGSPPFGWSGPAAPTPPRRPGRQAPRPHGPPRTTTTTTRARPAPLAVAARPAPPPAASPTHTPSAVSSRTGSPSAAASGRTPAPASTVPPSTPPPPASPPGAAAPAASLPARPRPAGGTALATRPAAASRAEGSAIVHHTDGLHGQALAALLAFAGLLALGTFLRRFRAPVT